MTAFLLAAALLAQTPAPAPAAAPPTDEHTTYTPAEAEAVFREANDAYYRKDYATAKDKYQRLIAGGFGGPDVLFNLGTTHLAAGELGAAVLQLERARAFGSDDDIEANLAVAQSRQVDQVVGAEAQEPFLQRVARATPERAVSIAFLCCWFLALMAFAIRWSGRGSWVLSVAAASLFFLGAIFGSLTTAHAYVTQTTQEGVVVSDTAQVREFPGEKAHVAFEVHAGLKVRVMESSGRYVRIRLPNALEGWTDKEGVVEL